MKKKLRGILCTVVCISALSVAANASTGSTYSVSFANGQQNAALSIYSNQTAAVGSYQNFDGGYVYTKCTSNYGLSKTVRAARNAGFMIDGSSFSTYHELVGGGWSNTYSR